MKRHRYECYHAHRQHYTYPVYEHIRANGGFALWECQVLEHFPFRTLSELREREQWWIDQLQPALNTMKAIRCAQPEQNNSIMTE